jgi:predicted ATPase
MISAWHHSFSKSTMDEQQVCFGHGLFWRRHSTLVNALGTRGFSMVQEPGRRIVSEELAGNGNALPWVDLAQFSRRAFSMAQVDLVRAKSFKGYVFFDRGLVDAAVSLQFAGGDAYSSTLRGVRHYADTVFVAPPWAEIFSQDEERRHGFGTAVAEFHRIQAALLDLGYDISRARITLDGGFVPHSRHPTKFDRRRPHLALRCSSPLNDGFTRLC